MKNYGKNKPLTKLLMALVMMMSVTGCEIIYPTTKTDRLFCTTAEKLPFTSHDIDVMSGALAAGVLKNTMQYDCYCNKQNCDQLEKLTRAK